MTIHLNGTALSSRLDDMSLGVYLRRRRRQSCIPASNIKQEVYLHDTNSGNLFHHAMPRLCRIDILEQTLTLTFVQLVTRTVVYKQTRRELFSLEYCEGSLNTSAFIAHLLGMFIAASTHLLAECSSESP